MSKPCVRKNCGHDKASHFDGKGACLCRGCDECPEFFDAATVNKALKDAIASKSRDMIKYGNDNFHHDIPKEEIEKALKPNLQFYSHVEIYVNGVKLEEEPIECSCEFDNASEPLAYEYSEDFLTPSNFTFELDKATGEKLDDIAESLYGIYRGPERVVFEIGDGRKMLDFSHPVYTTKKIY